MPSLAAHDLGDVECDATEYNRYSGNANIIMFRRNGWPYPDASTVLGLTTVTFESKTGIIRDVDIEINATRFEITTEDAGVAYDLQSILTHEVGHFLGLAHSNDLEATMYAKHKGGSTELRTLADDDVAGVCLIYPPAAMPGPCDVTPDRGLKPNCGDGTPPPAESSGCSLGGEKADGEGLILIVCLVWIVGSLRQLHRD